MKDLREFINYLEDSGELVKVREELSVKYEIPAAIKWISERDGRAVVFDRVSGYSVPVVANLLGSKKRLAMAMEVEEANLSEAYMKRRKKLIKPKVVGKGPVQENIISEQIDITKTIPVLTHHEKDAGPYFTSGVIISRDPETGLRSMGIHRTLVKGPDKVGMFLNSPPLSSFLEKAEKKAEPLEIAIVVGADPVTFFSAAISVPAGTDKMEVAGALAQRAIPLVKCQSVNLEVPANAEFVLEGKIVPSIREPEGPFGESTGYYLSYNNPVAEIQLICHRNQPIYHALLPFSGEEEILIDFLWQVEKKDQFLASIEGLRDLHLHFFGLITVAQVKKHNDKDGKRILGELMERFVWGKTFIVVDEDVDIHDIKDVLWALSTRFQPHKDTITKHNMPGLAIDPSADQRETVVAGSATLMTETSKIGLDATKPLDAEKFEKIRIPADVMDRIGSLLSRLK